MTDRWYREAVIYCVQVDLFHDSNGDGCGDLRGLISRLDYLSHLGITCLWLNPVTQRPFAPLAPGPRASSDPRVTRLARSPEWAKDHSGIQCDPKPGGGT